ncbi:MAG: hypothetical protein PHS60_00065 [Zavarzinia sp.]|nr:hypothetical protein [Zavarzinia sp.]
MTRSRLFRPAGPALAAGALVLAATLAGPAAAVEFDAGSGVTLELAPFAGYCAMDEARPAEAALIRTMRAAVGESMRVVLAFGDCEELVELRDGKRQFLNRFGQILLVAQGDTVQRVSDSRPEYLAKVAKPFPTATLDEVAANGEAQFKATRPADAPKPVFAVIGHDDMALYIATTSQQGHDDARTMVAGIAGISLVRQLQMNVNLFAAYDGSTAQGIQVLDDLHHQMAAGIADLQFVNEDVDTPVAALPVPNSSEWRAMGSTALVGALAGGLLGGVGAMVIVLLRRRRRRAPEEMTDPVAENAETEHPL